MKKIIALLSFFTVLLLLPGCGSSADTANNTPKSDSLYVFDEIPADTTAKVLEITPVSVPDPVPVVSQKKTVHYVQIGAFSTEDKARECVETAKKKLKKDFKIFYSQSLLLHVVQVMPSFSTKVEAETYRNELWKIKDYKDAWVTSAEE